MDLYFMPLACSMATRIALYEAGVTANYIEVDRKTKQTAGGENFFAVNPLGLVPVLRTDEGELVTENTAILQYVADQFPAAALAPASGIARTRLQEWLGFIGTEVHLAMFTPLFTPKTPEAYRELVISKGASRLDYLNKHLTGRKFLLDHLSVADAYLFTVLSWSRAVPAIDLSKWPAIKEYIRNLRERPAFAKALAEEGALYQAEQARHKAA
jgi:glutathione S-transferase